MEGETISPRVPISRMVMEDNEIPRICLSQSVYGCLSAIGNFEVGDILFLHECYVSQLSVIQPTREQVGDAFLFGEIWSTAPTLMHLVDIINITGLVESKVFGMDNVQYIFDKVEMEVE